VVSKGRHPKSAMSTALHALDRQRFALAEVHVGHRWGSVTCLVCGAHLAVWSTPRDADQHAKQIRRFAAKHRHHEEER
jgi:hypothetical protein